MSFIELSHFTSGTILNSLAVCWLCLHTDCKKDTLIHYFWFALEDWLIDLARRVK